MTSKQIGIGVAVIAALMIVGLFFVPHFINSLNGGNPSINSMDTSPSPATGSQGVPNVTELQKQDQVVGTGAEAKVGSTVTVHYTGQLTNGTVFDTSRGKTPFTFTIGAGEVIAGWEQGVPGMKVGGKRLLAIPSELGYGARPIQGRDQAGNVVDVIPANSTLLFEVELVSVQ